MFTSFTDAMQALLLIVLATEDADAVGGTLLYDAIGQINGYQRLSHAPEQSGARYHLHQSYPYDDPTPVYFTLGPDGELIGIDNGETVPELAFNSRGDILAYTDENYHTQRWVYGATGNLTGVVDKNGGVNAFTYDGQNRLISETTRLGEVITYAYNSVGQLERVQGPDAFVAYTYGAYGNIETIENETTLVQLTWDDRGFVSHVTSSGTTFDGMAPVTLGYSYADSGRFEGMQSPFGSVSLTYDDEGAPVDLIDSNTGTYRYAWQDDGLLASVTGPTGMATTYGYTPGQRLNKIQATDETGTPLQLVEIEYDQYGTISTKTDDYGRHFYSYDNEGRLISADHPDSSGIADEVYAYDAIGNRTEWAEHPAPAVQHDDGDRLIADALFTYDFDAEGRLVAQTERSSGGVTRYRWN